MERLVNMNREAYIASMRAEFEKVMGQVADAVNDAPKGHLIDGSENQVRDLLGEFRRKAYEQAVQMRVQETDSSFSPSQEHIGQAIAEQGSGGAERIKQQRSDRTASSAVSRQRVRRSRAGGSAD
jgi:hypothetical protein